jgi:hypothetical protein
MKAERAKRRVIRILSVLTLVFFLASQVSFASPRVGIEIAVNREMPGFLRIDIPTELASLDGIWEAPPASDSKVVLHIQNAHANYGAQKKIKELLEYLNKTYAIKTIFVEGAAEDLNPDFLKLFPDKARNLELADLLAQQGELTGAELFLLENDQGLGTPDLSVEQAKALSDSRGTSDESRAVRGYGIEDAGLYRNNYEALKKVFGSEVLVNRYLSGYESRLQALASKIFTNDLRRVLSDWQKFEKGHREFMPYIRSLAADAKHVLKLDLESLFAQVEWPQITRLLVLQGMEKDLDTAKALEEKDKLLGFLKAKGVSPGIIAEVENFKEQRMSVRQGQGDEMPPRDVLEALVKEAGPKGFSFRDYPAFSLYAGYLILKNELDAKGLFAEIKTLFGKILDSLALTPDQKGLLELYRDEELARKLLRLELSRRDWTEALGRKTEVQIDSLVSRLKELSTAITKEMNLAPSDLETKKLSPKFREQVLELYNAAFSFYEFARQRESVFYEKINAAMTRDASNKAIVITGGFHTDGVTDLFREHNVSYGVLTPRLMEKSDDKMYRNTMLQNEQQLFSISYLELAAKLQPIADLEAQGFDPVKILGTEWANFLKVGRFENIESAIKAFNDSVAATKASLKLNLAGKDESGKARLKLEKIARSETREVGYLYNRYNIDREGLIISATIDDVSYVYDEGSDQFISEKLDKNRLPKVLTRAAVIASAAMDATLFEDPTIKKPFSEYERAVITHTTMSHSLNFDQAQLLVQALAPLTPRKTDAAKFFAGQFFKQAKPVPSVDSKVKLMNAMNADTPFGRIGNNTDSRVSGDFADAIAKAIKSGVSLDRFNAIVRDSSGPLPNDFRQKAFDALLGDDARAQENKRQMFQIASMLLGKYIEEIEAPFFKRLFQGKMSSLAITKDLVSDELLKKRTREDLAQRKDKLQLMQELTPEQIIELSELLDSESRVRKVSLMDIRMLLGIPSLAAVAADMETAAEAPFKSLKLEAVKGIRVSSRSEAREITGETTVREAVDIWRASAAYERANPRGLDGGKNAGVFDSGAATLNGLVMFDGITGGMTIADLAKTVAEVLVAGEKGTQLQRDLRGYLEERKSRLALELLSRIVSSQESIENNTRILAAAALQTMADASTDLPLIFGRGMIPLRSEVREAAAKIYADQIKLVLKAMPAELAKLDLDRAGLDLAMVQKSLNSLLESDFKNTSPADILQKLRAIASVMSVDSQLADRTSRTAFSFEGEDLIVTYPSNRGEVVISGLRSIDISNEQFLVTHLDSETNVVRTDLLPLELSEPILKRMTYSEFGAVMAVKAVIGKALPKLSEGEKETLMSTTFAALQKIAGNVAVNDLSPEMQVTLVLTRGLAPEGDLEAAIGILAQIAALVDNADFTKKLQKAVPNSTIPMSVEAGKAARVEGGFNVESANQYVQQLFVAYLLNPNVQFRVLALGGAVNTKQLSDLINATASKFKKDGFAKRVSVLVLDKNSPVATQRNAAKKFITGYVVSGTEETFGQLGSLGLEIEGINLLRLWQDAAVSNDARVWGAVVKAAQNITGGNVGSSENIALLKQIAESGQKPGFTFDDKNRLVINLSSLSALKAVAALFEAFQQISKAA